MCGRAPGRGTGSCRYDRPASAEDEQFMRMALDEARHGDLPYSTVIVRDGQVIAREIWPGRMTIRRPMARC